MGVLEKIFDSLPPSRVQILGYQVAGILAFLGIVGIAIGIKILKKRQQLAAGLIGFFLVPVVIAIIVFIFGP
jgi:xanthosine utilization system XapX-like protein